MSTASAQPATVLIIDDDAEVRYSLGRVLSAGIYELE
jgi:CheY-like chemotaxis protein